MSFYTPPDCPPPKLGKNCPQPGQADQSQQTAGTAPASAQLAMLTGQAGAGPDPLQAQIGQAHDLLHQIDSKIIDHLRKQLDDCQGTIDGCHSSICGCYGLVLDDCEKQVQKRFDKIEQGLVNKLAQAYNLLARFGVTFPTDDELRERAGQRLIPPALGDAGGQRQAGQNPDPDKPVFQGIPLQQPQVAQQPGFGGRLTQELPPGSGGRLEQPQSGGGRKEDAVRPSFTPEGCLRVHMCHDPKEDDPPPDSETRVTPKQQLVASAMVATGIDDLALQG